MVKIPTKRSDPTLDAMNAALENTQQYRRGYLGMSGIGDECERKQQLQFRWADQPKFDAKTLKRFADGHASEAVMVARLKQTPGITLIDLDPETGRQWGFSDFGGHFRGHMDGHIEGLLQAPVTPHVFEHKCSEKTGALEKLVAVNEKTALAQWNETYYAQAVLYMDYGGYSRHYMTCSTPGTRDETSCRTNADPVAASRYKAKAERVIFSEDKLPRVNENKEFYKCRWCDFSAVCHNEKPVAKNCRTCAFVTAKRDGTWFCERHKETLSRDKQDVGCDGWLTHPMFMQGEPVNGSFDFIEYKLDTGEIVRDSVADENNGANGNDV